MREHPKSAWLDVHKRQWTKPEVREIEASAEIVAALRRKNGASPAIDKLARKLSASR
jgi:hypothetical protein